MSIINSGMKSLKNYLHDNSYYIPDYQRGYSWVTDQLEDFWQDLENNLNNDRHHFFGQIVIHQDKDTNKYYIIDGQQRTTTAAILFAVMRDLLDNYSHTNEDAKNTIEDIRIELLGRWSPSKDALKLHLSDSDQDYFKEHIQKAGPSNEGKTPSQNRIYKAYKYFEKNLQDTLQPILSDSEACVHELLKYYDTLTNYFDLMTIVTDDINEAFILFETLNSRGKDLETADLLKNYVFMQAGPNIDSIKAKWISMIDTLANKDDATKYIRYYWNATHDFTREKNLYKAISQEVKQSKCEQFVKDLDALSELYNALSKPEDNKYFEDNEIAEILMNLSVMKITSFYPIIFAMELKNYGEDAIKKVLQAIEILVFRNFVVASMSGNRFEMLFAKIAKEISNFYVEDKKIIECLTAETLDDEDFRRDLVGLEIKTVTIAKYVLREIEDYGHPEKHTSKDNKVINLEHIMPKSNTLWNVPEDEHSKYINRLANQTLLLDEYNRAISNKPFEIKKSMYSSSAIEMTQRLTAYAEWNSSSINNREQELISTIMQRWALMN